MFIKKMGQSISIEEPQEKDYVKLCSTVNCKLANAMFSLRSSADCLAGGSGDYMPICNSLRNLSKATQSAFRLQYKLDKINEIDPLQGAHIKQSCGKEIHRMNQLLYQSSTKMLSLHNLLMA
jgi:hypothetical protein